ncbi:MAG TPA: DoxX family membrane protein [Pseudolabrys sp.]
MENFLAPYRQQLLSVFRIMTGLLVLQYGPAKIIRFPAIQMFANVAVGQWPAWYAGVIELIFGTLLVRAERWINSILDAKETTPAGADRSAAEQAQAGA